MEGSNENEEVVADLLKGRIERLERETVADEEKYGILDEAHMEVIGQLREVKEEAIHDELTKLYTRAYLNDYVTNRRNFFPKENEVEEKREESRDRASIIIFDLDHFKAVNDTYGHQFGDEVLVAVAGVIKKNSRDEDVPTRWGGEELALVMEEVDLSTAVDRANEIREEISKLVFEDHKDFKVTASAGVAYSLDFGKYEDFFQAADDALYQSKQNGRNQVAAHMVK